MRKAARPGNARLRKAMDDAKAMNMPKDTMMNAVKRGTGEIAGAAIDDISYEGYGAGGVAIFTSFALELLVYPALYAIWKRREMQRDYCGEVTVSALPLDQG